MTDYSILDLIFQFCHYVSVEYAKPKRRLDILVKQKEHCHNYIIIL